MALNRKNEAKANGDSKIWSINPRRIRGDWHRGVNVLLVVMSKTLSYELDLQSLMYLTTMYPRIIIPKTAMRKF